MNIIGIIGNVTKDLELRHTPQGKAVLDISIAVNEGYGEKKEVSFFQAVIWDKTAENCSQYLGKGSKIAITGSLKQRRWEDKDGNKRSVVFIRAHRVEFLDKKKAEQTGNNGLNLGETN